jgi:hypothetical protein
VKNILLVTIIFLPYFSSGQNTWVRKLSYNTQMMGYFDTLTGVGQIEIGADGSIYILASTSAHGQQMLYKFFPGSNQPEWSTDAGYHFASGTQWTSHIKATSDSGVISCFNWLYLTDPTRGYVRKYAKDGTLEWDHDFSVLQSWPGRQTYDVVERNSGGYYVLVSDSMYTLDSSGNAIDSTGVISGTKFLETTNGDLLVFTGSDLHRMDISGNVIWSHSCDGYFAYDDVNVFIVNNNSFIQKVDALTGMQAWNIDYGLLHVSDIKATFDGGVIASAGYKPDGSMHGGGNGMQGFLVRADSVGDTVWTRSYTFPHFGLSAINIDPSNNIVTGGCYMSGDVTYDYKDYSAFVCMMNTDGSFPLQQVSYVAPADANNDHFLNFVDESLETMLALGNTGTPRDSSLDGIVILGEYVCGKNDIAIDWNTSSAAGVNHKHDDLDGNGVVDTNDVNALGIYWNCQDSSTFYYRYSNPELLFSVESFQLVPLEDTILPDESAYYYMILGNAGNPVDSIYGFAFTYFINPFADFVTMDTVYATAFGTPSVDLWDYHGHAFLSSGYVRNQTMFCRTNFQNAVNFYDTVGIIQFQGPFTSTVFAPTIADFKAILVDGTEILFSVSAGNIFIDSSSVKVEENINSTLKAYPNPADKELNLKVEKLIIVPTTISIVNLMGEEIKTLQLSQPDQTISVADLPDGFYTGKISSDKMTNSFSFIVQH